jgi:SulP family sulfate permease
VGLVLACALFIRRMSSLFSVELVAHEGHELRYKLFGALFFGAVAKIDVVLRAVENGPAGPVVVLDAIQLVLLDTTGMDALRQLHKAVLLKGGLLRMENLQAQPAETLRRSGFMAEMQAHRASPEVSI